MRLLLARGSRAVPAGAVIRPLPHARDLLVPRPLIGPRSGFCKRVQLRRAVLIGAVIRTLPRTRQPLLVRSDLLVPLRRDDLLVPLQWSLDVRGHYGMAPCDKDNSVMLQVGLSMACLS